MNRLGGFHARVGTNRRGRRVDGERASGRSERADWHRTPVGESHGEIRSYNLKPGTGDRFHQVFLKEALPMPDRWKIDVVVYGPSLHDKVSYFLMHAFEGIDQRQKAEDAFYSSDEWIKGPRERVLADIDSHTTSVVYLDDATLHGLRKGGGQAMNANDLDVLTKLNDDYIQSVQAALQDRGRP